MHSSRTALLLAAALLALVGFGAIAWSVLDAEKLEPPTAAGNGPLSEAPQEEHPPATNAPLLDSSPTASLNARVPEPSSNSRGPDSSEPSDSQRPGSLSTSPKQADEVPRRGYRGPPGAGPPTRFAQPDLGEDALLLRVEDASGRPVAGAPVAITWDIVVDGDQVPMPATAIYQTNELGVARLSSRACELSPPERKLYFEVLGVFRELQRAPIDRKSPREGQPAVIRLPPHGQVEFEITTSVAYFHSRSGQEQATLWLADAPDPGRHAYSTYLRRRLDVEGDACRFEFVEVDVPLLARLSRGWNLYEVISVRGPSRPGEVRRIQHAWPGLELVGRMFANGGRQLNGFDATIDGVGSRWMSPYPIIEFRVEESGALEAVSVHAALERQHPGPVVVTLQDGERLWKSPELELEFETGEPVVLGDVHLQPLQHLSSGRVLNSDGTPAAGAYVCVERFHAAPEGVWRTVRDAWDLSAVSTKEDGQYEVHVPEDGSRYRLAATCRGQVMKQEIAAFGQSLDLRFPPVARLRLKLTCEGLDLRLFLVRVVDPSGSELTKGSLGPEGGVDLPLAHEGSVRVLAKLPNQDTEIEVARAGLVLDEVADLGTVDLTGRLRHGLISVVRDDGTLPTRVRAFRDGQATAFASSFRGPHVRIVTTETSLPLRIEADGCAESQRVTFTGGAMEIELPALR